MDSCWIGDSNWRPHLAGVVFYSEKLILVDVTYPGAVTFTIYAILTFTNYTREAAEKKKCVAHLVCICRPIWSIN